MPVHPRRNVLRRSTSSPRSRIVRALRRGARSGRDQGTALATTLIVMMVMVSLSLVLLDRSLSSEHFARQDQDWNAAMSAAQAGIDDYVHRLNDSNGGYYTWSDVNPDPSNQAMGATAGRANWAAVPLVPGAAAATDRAWFHYGIDTSSYVGSGSVVSNGTIKIVSTGKVGTRIRTLTASVLRSGFLKFMYFTQYETKDPVLYTTAVDGYTSAWAAAKCANRFWDARAPTAARNANCSQIQFSNDTLNGQVHSNDAIMICSDATFQSQVTTAFAGSAATGYHAYRTNQCASPNTNVYPPAGTTFTPTVNNPTTVPSVGMPSTNSSLISYTDATASPRGCLYAGPTKIQIKGTQVKVTSPWTKPTSLPSVCRLNNYFDLPTAGVIYVEAVPTDSTSDPNSWGTSESGRPSCPAGPANTNNVGYPLVGEGNWSYGCRSGDVFIEDESGLRSNALDGRLTVGSAGDIYVTNNLWNKGDITGNSLLGLVAQGFIYYWHPVDTSANANLGTNNYPSTVQASMVSVDHSVTTQNYNIGADLGYLNLTGSLTQKYRGIVKAGTSGYSKNYRYDPRLAYDAPPHFLSPTNSTFSYSKLAETTTPALG